ncbi:hypothetical protein ACFFIA_05995 [Phytohabitans kaempferiae]|uniref:Uncharacterized protein n=1 Tax=Phytohabitans kaempferiae TaxID=1620943 RepID=A0ABV6LXS4_9ACTN
MFASAILAAPAQATSLCDRPEPPPSCWGGGGEGPDPVPVDHAARGALDEVSFVGNGVRVRGWAADIDTSNSLLVDIYIDDVFTQTLTANTYRPDVAAAHPSFGAYRGYDAFVPSRHGAHTVCAWAINVAPPGANPLPNHQLGCKTYNMPVVTNIVSSYDSLAKQWMIAFDDNVVGETRFDVRWDYYVWVTVPGTDWSYNQPRTWSTTLPAHEGTGRVTLPLLRPANATKLTISAPGFGSVSITNL